MIDPYPTANPTITQDTTQVTITGQLPTGTNGGFKYRYANTSNGDLDGNNSQQLPSSIKTIKIVLKKGA